ncbi:hypothetical protein [Lysinibacter cavernae]|uniref:Lipoprotein n=1 Tax=Lysinibacter cavernae TaxID=1640652 RepID=A0A7X5R362_9MICO|nr:hypothetical protein [Lysinibacter cavernae]NIH54672.1 hypothetical protein [Lysinibacter cavernae]
MRNVRTLPAALALAASLLAGGALAGCTSTDSGLPEGMPSGFKAATGEVSNAVTTGDNGWSFSVTVSDAEAQDAAIKRLTDDGYEIIGENEAGDTRTYSLSNGEINATVVLSTNGDDRLVIYNLVRVK